MAYRLIATLFLFFAGQAAMALEEPSFEIIAEYDDFEVRRYAPYIVAEVDVDSGNSGFRTLAGYIFGDNSDAEKMNMTAPVESRASEQDDLDTYSFVMESKYTLESLPKPNDERIRLLERPERVVAARRFSGRWTDRRFEREQQTLEQAMARQGLEASGAAELARYNGPFTLPFMRRNEILIPVIWGEPR